MIKLNIITFFTLLLLSGLAQTNEDLKYKIKNMGATTRSVVVGENPIQENDTSIVVSKKEVSDLRENLLFFKDNYHKLEIIVDSLEMAIIKLEEENEQIKKIVSQASEAPQKPTGTKSGYYVVISSSKSKDEMLKRQKQIKGLETKVTANKEKSWFYLYIDKNHPKKTVGQAVEKARNSGYEKAWWIKL